MTNVIRDRFRDRLVAPAVFCLVAPATASLSAQTTKMPMKPMNKSMPMKMDKSMPMKMDKSAPMKMDKSMPMKMDKSAPMVSGTEPSNGAELTEPPKTIRVSFIMPMRITVLKLTTETGETIPVALGQQKAAREFAVAIPELEPDSYSVEWQARGHDGHAMSGSFEFSVLEKE